MMEIMEEPPAVSSSRTEKPGMADSGVSKVGSGSDLGLVGVLVRRARKALNARLCCVHFVCSLVQQTPQVPFMSRAG